MSDIIGRLLDEAEKAQRKGHLVLAEVCRDASDQLGLVIDERDRLREALAGLLGVTDWANAALARGEDEQWVHTQLMQAAGNARAALKDTGHE